MILKYIITYIESYDSNLCLFVSSFLTDGFLEYRQSRCLCGCHQATLTNVHNVWKNFLCYCGYFISYGKNERTS